MRTNAHRQTMGHGNWSHIKACSLFVSPAQDEQREKRDRDRREGRKEFYDSKKERGDTVTPRYENRTERRGGICEKGNPDKRRYGDT